jgi:ATP-dependent Clp protease ATP-binding subunit ClpX
LHFPGGMIIVPAMKEKMEKIPNPQDIEKEIGEFLAKKFGDQVKVVSPMIMPQNLVDETEKPDKSKSREIHFDLKPAELIAYLDQYIIQQDRAKAILATKVCTHFNRIKRMESHPDQNFDMVGRIKNNVLMLGPTGVGKTYMIKLIANKIGVPFVKGDATKFSETGYVGGDVEDLVRDLVREADEDIELAQCGIIYIDEIDKIAGSRNLVGADVSRTGVQRALLKPMEETEVDLKVPHDPISMIQEIERFRKTGTKDKRSVNTKNILFIVSGAFGDLPEIIRRRLRKQSIGFGAKIVGTETVEELLHQVKAEDFISYGFESEFIGRLPVRAVFEPLTENNLYDILRNPNNPIILGKKIDFAGYGIQVKFADTVLKDLAKAAFLENTGARGLVSAVEDALLDLETRLPSSRIKQFPFTEETVRQPDRAIRACEDPPGCEELTDEYRRLEAAEKSDCKEYLTKNKSHLEEKYRFTLTPSRLETLATQYTRSILDIDRLIRTVKNRYDEIRKLELYFFENHDINIVLEEDAIDYIMEQLEASGINLDRFAEQLAKDFEPGLRLVRDKTGKNRFFVDRSALKSPEEFIRQLLQNKMIAPEASPPLNTE